MLPMLLLVLGCSHNHRSDCEDVCPPGGSCEFVKRYETEEGEWIRFETDVPPEPWVSVAQGWECVIVPFISDTLEI